jgi:two-component system response regulator VicR
MAHKILVVDDEHVVVEVVKDALKKRNYEVHAAFTGEEALEKVKDCSPDLIILDIRMPSMNGYEFMRALRAMRTIEEKKMLPVIMLTATEAMEDVFKLEGAKGYLIKPVNEELLFQKIKGCLGPND